MQSDITYRNDGYATILTVLFLFLLSNLVVPIFLAILCICQYATESLTLGESGITFRKFLFSVTTTVLPYNEIEKVTYLRRGLGIVIKRKGDGRLFWFLFIEKNHEVKEAIEARMESAK